jgi:hypothetical protein
MTRFDGSSSGKKDGHLGTDTFSLVCMLVIQFLQMQGIGAN